MTHIGIWELKISENLNKKFPRRFYITIATMIIQISLVGIVTSYISNVALLPAC